MTGPPDVNVGMLISDMAADSRYRDSNQRTIFEAGEEKGGPIVPHLRHSSKAKLIAWRYSIFLMNDARLLSSRMIGRDA